LTVLSNGTLAFVFNETLTGVGIWLRDSGRGPQEIAKIAEIAKIEN
jgi:hypothetical protein